MRLMPKKIPMPILNNVSLLFLNSYSFLPSHVPSLGHSAYFLHHSGDLLTNIFVWEEFSLFLAVLKIYLNSISVFWLILAFDRSHRFIKSLRNTDTRGYKFVNQLNKLDVAADGLSWFGIEVMMHIARICRTN